VTEGPPELKKGFVQTVSWWVTACRKGKGEGIVKSPPAFQGVGDSFGGNPQGGKDRKGERKREERIISLSKVYRGEPSLRKKMLDADGR